MKLKTNKKIVKCGLMLLSLVLFIGCAEKQMNQKTSETSSYFDYSNSYDQLTGGIKMIPITTPKGTFEEFGNFDGYLPNEEIEYIYYDQLESYYSDQPNDSTLWTTEHFVEEVEQVRKALNLNKDNFYLLGQSWGGILAMEYALKYQENL